MNNSVNMVGLCKNSTCTAYEYKSTVNIVLLEK